MQTVLLIYDIPEKSPAKNPSGVLRRLGIRINLSCWCLPEDALPHHTLAGLSVNGATWHTVRFAQSEGERLARLTIDTLTKELADLAESLDNSYAGFADQMEEWEPEWVGDDAGEVARAFRKRTHAAVRRAEKLLEDAQQAARSMGVDPTMLPVAMATARINCVKREADQRTTAYVEAASRLADAHLRLAAQEDLLPAFALADALEDEGQDSSELRAAI